LAGYACASRSITVAGWLAGTILIESSSAETVTLYRPVGPAELALIIEGGFRAFPARLPSQPIFYPVLTEEYATQITRDWNVKRAGAGYVLRFHVEGQSLDQYEIHKVGGHQHLEYWIPAGDLAEFNRHLVGPIEVISEFHRAGGGDAGKQ
jgi:hypothetical protein